MDNAFHHHYSKHVLMDDQDRLLPLKKPVPDYDYVLVESYCVINRFRKIWNQVTSFSYYKKLGFMTFY